MSGPTKARKKQPTKQDADRDPQDERDRQPHSKAEARRVPPPQLRPEGSREPHERQPR